MPDALDIETLPQHLVFTHVSWFFYEQLLEQIGNRPIRVAFLDGNLELMSPLPQHEAAKRAIGRLIETLTLEMGCPCKSFGSTTFRREEKAAGIEPDECYYFQDIAAVRGMKQFDPLIHRPPDLAVEVDIMSPSVPREPIYARLGVPEIWRFNGQQLSVRVLSSERIYADSPASRAFPFLPMSSFAEFIPAMIEDDETQVLMHFRNWVRTFQHS